MFFTIDFKRLIKIFIICFAVIGLLIGIKFISGINIESSYLRKDNNTLVIDAGHGGIDGGAISEDGTKESDINLAIALKAKSISDFLGINTILTRETDTDWSEDCEYSEHNNLIKRAELVNSTENAVLISIHQNKFTSTLVSGAEVMYADNEQSKSLGLLTQDNILMLNNENRRVARPAPSNLLLTASVNCPAILVECGFMSNPDDVANLSDSSYQLKIAGILIASYIQFIDNTAST